MTTEQEELFKADPFIKLVLETIGISSINLIGGAVIDILEGRTPKDYDTIGGLDLYKNKLGLEFQYETKTAKTYKTGDLIIQDLKTQKEDFDFKISQATLKVDYNKKLSLQIDADSFDNKTLLPCERCWTEKSNALKALQRVVHWHKKGYEINDITYLSLLGVVGKNNNVNS
jgi:hypothetical protein